MSKAVTKQPPAVPAKTWTKSKKYSPQQEAKAILIQRAYRSFRIRKLFHHCVHEFRKNPAAETLRMRIKAAFEIVESEGVYVMGLTELITGYLIPLETELANNPTFPLSKIEMQQIFINIDTISSYQEIFYEELCNEFRKWPAAPLLIGKVFTSLAPFMKLYTDYTNNYQQSIDTMEICKKREPVARFFEKQHVEAGMTDISSLLITPVQRVPRYKMLLEALIKYTPEEHVDYKNLQNALKQISTIGTHINETKRGVENITEIHKVTANIRGIPLNLAHPGRSLVKSGVMLRQTEARAHEERMFYLFNDMLLSVKQSDLNKEEGFYDGYVLLRGASAILSSVPQSFQLKLKNDKLLTYHLPSHEKFSEWFPLLQQTIQKITSSPKDTAPDLLLEIEHFSSGNTQKTGKIAIFEPGHLTSKIIKNRKRFVTIQPGLLIVRKSSSSREIMFACQLERYSIRSSKPNQFELVGNAVTHTFITKSEPEKQAWVSAIAAASVKEEGNITDICIIHWDKGEEIPLGYSAIMEAYGGQSANLNFGAGSSEIYLCIQRNGRDSDGNPKAPITELGVLFTDNGWVLGRKAPETLPENESWTLLSNSYYGTYSGDVNGGVGGREILLAYRRDPNQSPITGISCFWPKSKDPAFAEIPQGYVPLTKTVTGRYVANLNTGNSATEVFLCYETKAAKLGWDPKTGIKRESLPDSWSHLLEGIDPEVLAHPEKSRRILQVIEEFAPKKNSMDCSRCFQQFEYEDVPFSIFCPYCGYANYTSAHQLPPPNKAVPGKEKRALAQTTPAQAAKPPQNKPVLATSATTSNLYSFGGGPQSSTPPATQETHPEVQPVSSLYSAEPASVPALYSMEYSGSQLYNVSHPAEHPPSQLYACSNQPQSSLYNWSTPNTGLYSFSPVSMLSAGLRKELQLDASVPKKKPPVPPPRPSRPRLNTVAAVTGIPLNKNPRQGADLNALTKQDYATLVSRVNQVAKS